MEVPVPLSGGLILSYSCSCRCLHCMYACSPRWEEDWISETDLESIVSGLEGRILPSPYGPQNVSLNHGLHFTGGDWCVDEETTREKLEILKSRGLSGILISVHPFYLEWVPFGRTKTAVAIGHEVFGRNMFVYQADYYRLFEKMGIEGTYEAGPIPENIEFFSWGGRHTGSGKGRRGTEKKSFLGRGVSAVFSGSGTTILIITEITSRDTAAASRSVTVEACPLFSRRDSIRMKCRCSDFSQAMTWRAYFILPLISGTWSARRDTSPAVTSARI